MSKTIVKFEDLLVWQEGMNLAEEIYKITHEMKDYALLNQMRRAAVSIPSNIAEGFERNSNKEFIQFLFIAKGSCGELRTQIQISGRVGFVEKKIENALIEQTQKISAMLFKLIETRKTKF